MVASSSSSLVDAFFRDVYSLVLNLLFFLGSH